MLLFEITKAQACGFQFQIIDTGCEIPALVLIYLPLRASAATGLIRAAVAAAPHSGAH